MSYGPNYADQARSAATVVGKILKGAKPSELPVEQATALELVVNLKTARAIEIPIPKEVMLRADHVIE
jgi:putative ABC transport system substrate-binding protein